MLEMSCMRLNLMNRQADCFDASQPSDAYQFNLYTIFNGDARQGNTSHILWYLMLS